MIYVDCPSVLLSRVTRLPTTGVFESQKAKSHIEISLPLLMIFVNFEHTECALKLHISYFQIPYYEGQ